MVESRYTGGCIKVFNLDVFKLFLNKMLEKNLLESKLKHDN